MKIDRFTIQNYRAISSVQISLRAGITPIIGVNESGKTTILHALQAFDKGRDVYNTSRNHLDFQNRYDTTDTKDCKIVAEASLEKFEWEEIEAAFPTTVSAADRRTLRDMRERSARISFARRLDSANGKEGRKYQLESSGFSEKAAKLICKYLVLRIPVILYFDDFTDRVPETIRFPEEYITSGTLNTRGPAREWQELIRELFRRSQADMTNRDGKSSDPLRDFFRIGDEDRRDGILEDISDTLNAEIIKDWKSLRNSGLKNFADDSTDLKLRLRTEKKQDLIEVSFRVVDKAHKGKKRPFPITDRSKGFQWFFNYMMKLKFNPRYKEKEENSIFLLDEPGSYLHSSAQSELLTELKNVSKKNAIIYCTHSQFLLDPKIIRLGAIRIARRNNGNVELVNFGESKDKNLGGALAPVYQALELHITRDFIGNVLLVEGVSDFCFFRILLDNIDKLKGCDWSVIPAGSASKVSSLLGFALGFSEKFLVFLDRDDAGSTEAQRIHDHFGEDVSKKVLQYGGADGKCRLENLLSEAEARSILAITSCDKLKNAIPVFFWNFKEHHENFVRNLSPDTLSKILPLIEALDS